MACALVHMFHFALWTCLFSGVWLSIAKPLCVRHGSKIAIPCLDMKNSLQGSITWKYNKDGTAKTLISRGNGGVLLKSEGLGIKYEIARNLSLILTDVTDKYKGTYSCEICEMNKIKKCTKGLNTTLSVFKESNLKSMGVREGAAFTYQCPAPDYRSVRWKFQGINQEVYTSLILNEGSSRISQLYNGSLHLKKAEPGDAGIYSCWIQCRSEHKLQTLSLHVQRAKNPSCTFMTPLNTTSESKAESKTAPSNYNDTGRQKELIMIIVVGTSISVVFIVVFLCFIYLWRLKHISDPKQSDDVPHFRITQNITTNQDTSEVLSTPTLTITNNPNACLAECVYSALTFPKHTTGGR